MYFHFLSEHTYSDILYHAVPAVPLAACFYRNEFYMKGKNEALRVLLGRKGSSRNENWVVEVGYPDPGFIFISDLLCVFRNEGFGYSKYKIFFPFFENCIEGLRSICFRVQRCC